MNLFSYHTKNIKEKQDPHDKWMQENVSYFPSDLEERLKDFGHKHMSQVKLTSVHTATNYAIAQEQNADVILRVSPNHFPIYNYR